MHYLKNSSCNILFLYIKFDINFFLNGILMCVYIEEICGPKTWKLQYHVAVETDIYYKSSVDFCISCILNSSFDCLHNCNLQKQIHSAILN